MYELNLEEAIMKKYGKQKAPNTFSLGKNTIDGIFVSMGMVIEQGGYIDSTYCPGDHHSLWIDIKYNTVWGESMNEQVSPTKCKVTSKIPSIKSKFNKELGKQMKQHNIKRKTDDIFNKCKEEMDLEGKISESSSFMLEKIYDRIKRAIICADRKCRKMRKGEVRFSAEIKKYVVGY